MSDLLSTGDPTSAQPVVAPSSTSGPALVSPAQTPSSQQIVDISGTIAQYEQRLRNLMSEKDKAINERNQAINQLTDLQKQHTEYQAQTQSSLTSAANSAQLSIDRAKQLEQEMIALQGQSLRANALLEKPHLAPYANFIPASNDPEKVNEAIAQLEKIRQEDLARLNATMTPRVPQQPFATPSSENQQALTQHQQNQAAVNALYQDRANMPLSLLPGSNPAQMLPGSSSPDPTAQIKDLFAKARASGNPADFESAMAQSKLLAESDINHRLGRF